MHKDLNENCDKSLINLEGLLSDSWDDSEFTEFVCLFVFIQVFYIYILCILMFRRKMSTSWI